MKKILLILLTLALLASPAWGMRWVGYDDPIHPTVNLDPFSTITATGFTANLSIVNGTAFITNPSVDLSKYQGRKLTLTAGGKTLVGWGKAAGTGETGTEFLRDGAFAAAGWSVQAGWANTGVATNAAVDALIYQDTENIGGVGLLYKLVFTIPAYTDGSVRFYHGVQYFTARNSAGTFTEYLTKAALAAGWCAFAARTIGTDLTVANASYKELTAPSASGITIVSAKGGATQNWTSDDGIDPNAASFTLTVEKQ